MLEPGILEKADIAMQDHSDVAEVLQLDAMKCLLDHFNTLGGWYTDLLSQLQDQVNGSDSPDSTPRPLKDPEWFMDQGFDIATWMITYWTGRLATCATIRVLSQKRPIEHAINTFNRDEYDPHIYAINIVKSMRNFFSPEAGILAFQASALQLGIVLAFFAAFYPTEPSERELIRTMLASAAQSGPYGPLILGFLKQMHAQTVQDLDGKQKSITGSTEWAKERTKGQIWYRVEQSNQRQPTV